MKVGDKIYLVEKHFGVVEHEISKVGRKWFYAGTRLRFGIKTRREDVFATGMSRYAYLSLQEIEDKQEENKLYEFINEKFRYYNGKMSLENLRKIEQIIKSEE